MGLIDADVYLKKVCTYNETGCGSCKLQTACPFDEPIVDAVPVVRCGKCLKKRLCILYRETNDENGFCAWGDEKKNMEMIDKKQAYQILSEYYHHTSALQHMALKEALDRVPVVDAVPVKHGYWIFNPKDAIEMTFTLLKCSECGAESADGGNYCPNCGARMDEE